MFFHFLGGPSWALLQDSEVAFAIKIFSLLLRKRKGRGRRGNRSPNCLYEIFSTSAGKHGSGCTSHDKAINRQPLLPIDTPMETSALEEGVHTQARACFAKGAGEARQKI